MQIPKRPLGETGVLVSALGLGGYHVAMAGSEREGNAMSLPVATTVSGIDSMKVLRQNLKVGVGFKPMSERQMNTLRRRVRGEAADGRFELYKTSAKMEGPVGRKQHGFPDEQELSA